MILSNSLALSERLRQEKGRIRENMSEYFLF
jgi:hypothetical protein